MLLVIIVYYLFLSSNWLSVTVMNILRREFTFTAIITLGIGIVFILFKIYDIGCEVTTHDNQETTFEVKLHNKSKFASENSKTDNKVIRLNNYKKERLYK